VNRTAISERDGSLSFDFGLFHPVAATTDDVAPSMFTAIQDQLGLKLESGRGPVPYFVIDAAQKPGKH